MFTLIVVVCGFVLTSSSCLGATTPMTLHRPQPSLVTKYGAKCIDGSVPAMHLRLGTTPHWVLFLEGGGWCFDTTHDTALANCANWWGRSSNGQPPTMDDAGGIMSGDPTINPGFYNWNVAFLHYCDGGSFGSNVSLPYSYNGNLVWFRGRANLDAMVEELVVTYGLGKSSTLSNQTSVILSGGSAGALATFFNLDHFSEFLHISLQMPTVHVVGFPDAGYFLDVVNVATKTHNYRTLMMGGDSVWKASDPVSGGTNAKCLSFYAPRNETWKCLFSPNILPFIQTPVFVMNSAFDAYQVPNVFGLQCLNNGLGCTGADLTTLENNRMTMINHLKAGLKPNVDGAFLDSCYVHEQNVNYCSGQSIPNCVGWSPNSSGSQKWNYTTSVGGMTPQGAFTAWFQQQKALVLIDSYVYLTNPSCKWTGRPPAV